MRREVLGYVKKATAGLMAAALVLAGTVVSTVSVDAANTTGVVYKQVDNATFKTYWKADLKKAPAYSDIVANATEDYLFGGWYSEATDGHALTAEEAAAAKGTVYAKFVPATLMSVKVQNASGVTASSDSANVRLVSAVDSLDYEKVGFVFYSNDTPSKGDKVNTTKVYQDLKAGESTLLPEAVFGTAAKYFTAWRLTGIIKANFSKVVYVRPYWITKDGTEVEGLPKYAHVEDGIERYVNVPIYLSDVSTAAGVLSVTKPAGVGDVVGIEKGHVFGEMDHAVNGDTVKVVGNVSDITRNANGNDIYVNIRYKAGTYSGVGSGLIGFTVGSEDFCDKDETRVTVDVWDVQY